jgi:hypothetical protein
MENEQMSSKGMLNACIEQDCQLAFLRTKNPNYDILGNALE